MKISEIKRTNREKGFYFFEKGAMDFFNSKIESDPVSGPGGVFFVTSEQQDGRHARLFSVRRFDSASGDVKTVGEFQGFFSRREAMDEAKKVAKGE